MRIKIDISIKAGRIVKLFVMADVVLLAGWGMIAPIFSIFIVEQIVGATLITVGISSAIYMLAKSVLQIPVANYLDKTKGERDSFYVLIIGLALAAVTAFSFILIDQIWQLYLVQFLHAVAFGLYVPAWSGMFSRHLDKKHYALDWSLDSTAIGISAGITGAIGGVLANSFGFNIVFILAAVLSLLAIFSVISVPKLIFPHRTNKPTVIKDHSPK